MPQDRASDSSWQCEQLLRRATMLMDRGDWNAYVDCFTEDATLARPSDPDNPIVGRDAILASLLERAARITCHLLANSVFDVVSDSEVLAESRVLLVSGDPSEQRPAPAHPNVLAGTLNDRLVRIGDEWKIAERSGSIELRLEAGTSGDTD